MITTETFNINDKEFIKYSSDSGFYIQCVETEEKYSEAIDLAEIIGRTYIETTELIPVKNDTENKNPINIPNKMMNRMRNINS